MRLATLDYTVNLRPALATHCGIVLEGRKNGKVSGRKDGWKEGGRKVGYSDAPQFGITEEFRSIVTGLLPVNSPSPVGWLSCPALLWLDCFCTAGRM